MTNLTRYQLLQHRHLSLLKVLQDSDVSAKYTDSGWDVTYMFRADPGAGDDMTFYGTPCKIEQPPHRSIPDVSYAQDVWTMDANGKVTFRHASDRDAPDWVQEFEKKWGVVPAALPTDNQNAYTLSLRVDLGRSTMAVSTTDASYIKTINSTQEMVDLLQRLHAAILRASPAKVD